MSVIKFHFRFNGIVKELHQINTFDFLHKDVADSDIFTIFPLPHSFLDKLVNLASHLQIKLFHQLPLIFLLHHKVRLIFIIILIDFHCKFAAIFLYEFHDSDTTLTECFQYFVTITLRSFNFASFNYFRLFLLLLRYGLDCSRFLVVISVSLLHGFIFKINKGTAEILILNN